MIYWTAYNNSTFKAEMKEATTLFAAVREARRFLRNELYGEGTIHYYHSKDAPVPFRTDELSIHTKYRWEVWQ